MFEEEIKHHDELFSGSSWELGKIHWYIQQADTEMESKSLIKGEGFLEQDKLTDFGKDVVDEIHWWIFKKETEIEELLKRTESILNSVQKLKEDSSLLKEKYYPESYLDIIKKIKEFTESHKSEIRTLYDYVVWLHKKDVLAPSILFTYRVWGSTRLGDRAVKITANTIDKDRGKVKICTELALGLRTRFRYTIEGVYGDILSDIVDSIDPECQSSISVPKQRLLVQTSHTILDELATYFEFLRQSLRNIILDIKRYNAQTELLYRESFWKSFIIKAMSVNRIENQLWDFKKTLEMWHTKYKEKKEAEIKFCEQIAAFANANGGVVIVGITDKSPRRIIGVQDLENKSKFTKEVLKRHITYSTDFVHFRQILMKDEAENDKNCLIIAIAQTKDVISVKDKLGKFSYPIRLETGLDRSNYDEIKYSKLNVLHDNHNFILNLDRFLHDR
ncbi:MAG: ATP-binding protein [Methanosarcinales archaeon]|nr:MAG: ATP-binding protein [Methanosarcinales archaeon]